MEESDDRRMSALADAIAALVIAEGNRHISTHPERAASLVALGLHVVRLWHGEAASDALLENYTKGIYTPSEEAN